MKKFYKTITTITISANFMNPNIKFFLLCPVPEDQKPINEYIALQENFLTSWTTLSPKNYEKRIRTLLFFSFLITSMFQLDKFQGIYYIFDWSLQTLQLSTGFAIVILLIIFSRWLQIKYRFQQARLFYEEASWYDGQIWEKSLLLIKNDQLILSQKIQPIINRIKKTLIQILSVNLFCLLMIEI